MNSRETYVVGVDGGGTGCRVRICDRFGQELGAAEGGPANVTSDLDGALGNLKATIDAAYRAAGCAPARCGADVAWLGLAGAGLVDISRRVEAALGFARARVSSDSATVTQGALGDGDGVVALVGTGSFFLRRMGGGERRIGGWGYQLGDEAGGAWLGREALRRVLWAHDGLCAHSPLSRELLAGFEGDPDRLVLFARSASPGKIAAFAPRIAAASDGGDVLAQAVMQAGVNEIRLRLDALDAGTGDESAMAGGADMPLYLLGGLAGVYAKLLPNRWRDRLRPARGSALDGATQLAMHHLLPAR